jgi:hypothetical protein
MSFTPKSPERLEKRLVRVARERGIGQERLWRWVPDIGVSLDGPSGACA